MSDAQTGHHNLVVPIHGGNISTIEIIHGGNSRKLGINSLAGTLNLITKEPEKSYFDIDLSAGSFFTYNVNLSSAYKGIKSTHYISAIHSQSNGFDYNTDYSKLSFFYENNIRNKALSAKTMLAYTDAGFGAQSFYAAHFPDQYEKIKTGFIAFKLEWGDKLNWEYKLYHRILKDRFELFREHEDFYKHIDGKWINNITNDTVPWNYNHNYHYTNITGSGISFSKELDYGDISSGLEYRYEHIYSNVLGFNLFQVFNEYYIKSVDRQNLNWFADYNLKLGRNNLNAGVLFYYNQKYSFDYSFGFDFERQLCNKLKLNAGINRSMRLPSFTELFYFGPTNQGNPDLTPEYAMNFDLGLHYVRDNNSRLNINIFYRKGQNIISWIREVDSVLWKTENLTNLNTMGIEAGYYYSCFKEKCFVNSFQVSYVFIEQSKTAGQLESIYTLDNLRHKLILNINHKLINNLSAQLNINAFKRNGSFIFYDRDLKAFTTPVNYQFVCLVNYSLVFEKDFFKLYLNAHNILNTDYFDIGNVPVPGIMLMLGVKIKVDKLIKKNP